MAKVYLVGSLREPSVPHLANDIEAAGHLVFADWFAAGERADDSWQEYCQIRGLSYRDALEAPAAEHVFEFDISWLNWADTAVVVYPAGKSAHMEGMYVKYERKGRFFVYMPEGTEPERWDVMLKFCDGIAYTKEELLGFLDGPSKYRPETPIPISDRTLLRAVAADPPPFVGGPVFPGWR